MLLSRLTPHELRAYDVAHAVRHKDGCRHEALLGVSRDIGHANGDDETDGAAEEAGDGVANDGCSGVVGPCASPNDGTSRNDREAGENQHDDADILELGSEEACDKDDDKADRTKWKLEENGLEGRPAERRDNQRSKTADGAIHHVSRGHHHRDKPHFDIEDGFLQLVPLECGAAHASLAVPQSLYSRKPLLLG